MLILLLLPATYVGYVRFRSPAAALADFYDSAGRGEDQLADPLILTGCGAAGVVIREIQKPDMPLRRYAIWYLGNRRCSEALPALRTILSNESESDYFRADALEAITGIDRGEGARQAARYVKRPDHLGEVSRQIVAGNGRPFIRTYWEALRSVHN